MIGREISHSKPTLTDADHAALERSIGGGMIADGDVTRAFETAMGRRLGLSHGVAAGSGTAALITALEAVGAGSGDEVIMPTYVCEAVWFAISATGAKPVLCDVDMDRCMSRTTVERAISNRTRAIVVVHPLGAMADAASIKGLGPATVEDCCQALGASRQGAAAGTIGDACVLSFHATKLLTTGEGGMALSSVAAVGERLDASRHARRFPLADLQSALGISQLDRFDSFLARRKAIADFYFAELRGTAVELPSDVRDRSVFFRFPVRTKLPFDQVRQSFAAEGVHVRRGVDALIHQRFRVAGHFPNAERLFAETVSLPIYPALSDDEMQRVAAAARRVFGAR